MELLQPFQLTIPVYEKGRKTFHGMIYSDEYGGSRENGDWENLYHVMGLLFSPKTKGELYERKRRQKKNSEKET